MLADEFNADISILDMDAPNAEMNWQHFQKNYPRDRPVVIFSLHPVFYQRNALFSVQTNRNKCSAERAEKQRIELEKQIGQDARF